MRSDTSKTTCPGQFGCAWSPHNYKHFPFRGMKQGHTTHGPARYLPGTNIQDMETQTVTIGERSLRGDLQSEYRRNTGAIIGWDRGQDATISFVECGGGLSGGRAYHGRPMAASNPKVEAG